MIRALIDANLPISFLLTPASASPAIAIMSAAIAGRFRILIALETIEEMRSRVVHKPYLAARISPSEVDALIGALRDVAEILPALIGTIPAVSRDRKDDYLLAHAVAARPDYLVTGDGDLLSLGTHGGVQIVDPVTFALRLELIPEPDR